MAKFKPLPFSKPILSRDSINRVSPDSFQVSENEKIYIRDKYKQLLYEDPEFINELLVLSREYKLNKIKNE